MSSPSLLTPGQRSGADLAVSPLAALKPAAECRYDLVALGECLVRLSPPGHGRIEFAKILEIDIGGGEYNVAYAGARLGLRTAFVSKLPNNAVAQIILNHARSAGMDVAQVVLEPHDGIGLANRVGLYFAEIGTGVRGGLALFDRGHSSASQLRPGEVDWQQLFQQPGVRCLHTGGIFAVLSNSTRATLQVAIRAAKAAGTLVSYDLNFRPALADSATAAVINREFVAAADILLGSPDGFRALLGTNAPGVSEGTHVLVQSVAKTFPQLQWIAGTERTIHQGHRHDLAGFLWAQGRYHFSKGFSDLEIVDRVGTGDAFAASILLGTLLAHDPAQTLESALAHAALVHTTRGDTSQFSAAEIQEVASGARAVMRR